MRRERNHGQVGQEKEISSHSTGRTWNPLSIPPPKLFMSSGESNSGCPGQEPKFLGLA